ncbi:response regulator transcription factor [Clostridium sp. SHJSY1]|uniref:response regulator transcription factor n=1 Tax=Clostridium sp. SHJSY1 TaxID=2942483 RepID=UPI00287607D9|nr:response regulator transcription factor [Clostridium sp. SHJSY1]MDS0527028.1 response regulator transcription factor [Clostridium sp. SHJSY1]
MIKLAITDDHALIREGLIRIISYEKDLEIVLESDSGEDLIEKLKEITPDIILLDINMDKLDGVETLKIVKKKWPDIKIIILTVEKQKRKIKEVLDFGAEGYVLKESAGNAITNAIRAVFSGEKYIDKTLMESVFIDDYISTNENKLENLSNRELSILIKISEGKKNKEIAEMLFLSEKTVKNYVTSIFRKIEVEDRVHATLYAIENNVSGFYEEKNKGNNLEDYT